MPTRFGLLLLLLLLARAGGIMLWVCYKYVCVRIDFSLRTRSTLHFAYWGKKQNLEHTEPC